VIRARQTSAGQKALWSGERKPLPFQRRVPGGRDGAQLQSNRDVSSGSRAACGNPISPRRSAGPVLLFTCTTSSSSSSEERARESERERGAKAERPSFGPIKDRRGRGDVCSRAPMVTPVWSTDLRALKVWRTAKSKDCGLNLRV
jgi:hypothetical protein